MTKIIPLSEKEERIYLKGFIEGVNQTLDKQKEEFEDDKNNTTK